MSGLACLNFAMTAEKSLVWNGTDSVATTSSPAFLASSIAPSATSLVCGWSSTRKAMVR